jgi:hypothetical protein
VETPRVNRSEATNRRDIARVVNLCAEFMIPLA